MDYTTYENYTTIDFILDDDFREAVREGASKAIVADLIKKYPDKKESIDSAIFIIKGLQVQTNRQPTKKQQDGWLEIVQKSSAKKKSIKRYYYRIAVSVLLVVGIGCGILLLEHQHQSDHFAEVARVQSCETQLILSDGKSVKLDNEQSTVQYSPDGAAVIVDDQSELRQPVKKETFNKLIVPYGKRSSIVLSEGTKVWLNSGSCLTFPPAFTKNKREVFVEGEAYFEVEKDATRPFIVNTDRFSLKVYGTKFNVCAYKQDVKSNVVLVEGKVGMRTTVSSDAPEVFLTPSQKASIVKGENQFAISNVENVDVYTAWIDGYLTFTNEEVSEVLKRISRYYNINIECRLPEDHDKIYGKLDLKNDLERVLSGIAFISNTEYIKDENSYVFRNK